MKALLAAFALAVSASAFAANDSVNPTLHERSNVATCNGDNCWSTGGTPRSVPEPDTIWLLAAIGGIGWLISRRRK